MEQRTLGKSGFSVLALGLGCISLGAIYGEPSERSELVALLRSAIERGITFFDTAEAYGVFANEELVGEALEPVRDRCESAWNKAPVFGVIGVQTGPL